MVIGKRKEISKMTLRTFVEKNRTTLVDSIKSICSNCQIDDDEDIEDWIANDEGLYNWAIDSGVEDI